MTEPTILVIDLDDLDEFLAALPDDDGSDPPDPQGEEFDDWRHYQWHQENGAYGFTE